MADLADGYGLKVIRIKKKPISVVLSIYENGVIHRIVLPIEHPLIKKLKGEF